MILASHGDLWLHQPNGEEYARMLYKQALRLWEDMRGVDQGIGIVRPWLGLRKWRRNKAKRSGQEDSLES